MTEEDGSLDPGGRVSSESPFKNENKHPDLSPQITNQAIQNPGSNKVVPVLSLDANTIDRDLFSDEKEDSE